MNRKWIEWTEKNPIHLKTIVEAYAVGRIHATEWDDFHIPIFFPSVLENFGFELRKRFGDDEVPELTLGEVSLLFDEIFSNAMKNLEGFEETFDVLKSRALRYIRDDIRDSKEFEKWFRKAYTGTMK